MTFVYGIIVLGFVVLIHELGHFLVARGFGVRVEKFSIGFGPALLARKIGDTVYAISAVPLGGYVKMAGEHVDEEGATGAPDEFLSQHWAKRVAIVVAGPLANFVLALVANCLVGFVGYPVPTAPNVVAEATAAAATAGFLPGDRVIAVAGQSIATWDDLFMALEKAPVDAPIPVTVARPSGPANLTVPAGEAASVQAGLTPRIESVVGDVAPSMPADQAGLKPGDRVVKVDGVPVSTWEEMRKLINKRPDEKVEIEFERAGRSYTVAVRTIAQKDDTTGELIGVIGITLPTVTVTMPAGEAIRAGFVQTWHTIGMTYRGFAELVSAPRQAARQVAGPITIAQIAGSSAERGGGRLLYFIAFISVALMALNLLPIPVLDGGHAFFFLIEGLRGRRLSDRSQLVFQKVGLVLIGGLIVFSVANDALRQFERARGRQELDRQTPASQSP